MCTGYTPGIVFLVNSSSRPNSQPQRLVLFFDQTLRADELLIISKLTKPHTCITRTIRTVKDKAKLQENKLEVPSILDKKVPQAIFLFLIVSSWQQAKGNNTRLRNFSTSSESGLDLSVEYFVDVKSNLYRYRLRGKADEIAHLRTYILLMYSSSRRKQRTTEVCT